MTNIWARSLPAKRSLSCGSFAAVPRQTVLTDFLVDRIYPVEAGAGCEVVARADGRIVGTIRKTQKGSASYFGFRPRDDQSASLGYETRTLFEILHAVGGLSVQREIRRGE